MGSVGAHPHTAGAYAGPTQVPTKVAPAQSWVHRVLSSRAVQVDFMPPGPQKDAIIGPGPVWDPYSAQNPGWGLYSTKTLLNGGSAEFPTGELSPPSSTETAISTMVLPRTHAPHRRNKKGRTHRQPKKKKKKQKLKPKIFDRCRDKDETTSWGVLCPQIPARASAFSK